MSGIDIAAAFAHDVKHHVMIAEELAKALRVSASAEQLGMISRLERTLKRIILETNEVLLTGKFEAGLLSTALLNSQLNDVVRECLEEMRVLSESSGNKISFTPGKDLPLVALDPALFPSVVNNLLDNALKYADENSVVKVTTVIDAEDVVLRVSSTGAPIDPVEVQTLFQRFSRGSNAAGKPGTGLGLFIIRQIVEAHGGEVIIAPGAASQKETAIEVRLPVAAA